MDTGITHALGVTSAQFQADVVSMVWANRDHADAAARFLNHLVETQVITREASEAIWNEVMGAPAKEGLP